jgi:polar amino acid transport system substrate-binding protein
VTVNQGACCIRLIEVALSGTMRAGWAGTRTAWTANHRGRHMRKFSFAGCMLVIATFAITTAASHAQQTTLRFTTQDFAPFNYEIDGKVAGPAQEIIAAACAKIKAKCTFELLPWARAQKEVAEGKANGMFVIGWNKPRAEVLHFSPPLMKTEYGFFAHVDSKLRYKSLADIQGMMVAVYGPSNTSLSLERLRDRMTEQKLTPFHIEVRPDDEAGVKKLAATRVDAVFSNREVGFALAAKLGLRDKIRYAGKTSELNYYIGFDRTHNDPKILATFDAAVAELMKDGTAKKILDKFEIQLPDVRLDDAKTMTQ